MTGSATWRPHARRLRSNLVVLVWTWNQAAWSEQDEDDLELRLRLSVSSRLSVCVCVFFLMLTRRRAQPFKFSRPVDNQLFKMLTQSRYRSVEAAARLWGGGRGECESHLKDEGRTEDGGTDGPSSVLISGVSYLSLLSVLLRPLETDVQAPCFTFCFPRWRVFVAPLYKYLLGADQ